MSTNGKNLIRETSRSHLGKGFLRLLSKVRLSVLSAIEDESARAAAVASQDVDKNMFDNLPEPPHLEPGELKCGNGMHDYF
jgi:hypothetical protein